MQQGKNQKKAPQQQQEHKQKKILIWISLPRTQKDRGSSREREREVVGKGAIRKIKKNSTQGEIVAKPKPAEQRDNQRREEQGKIGEERNIKTRSTFSVLREEEREPIPEEDSPQELKQTKMKRK